jgi:hypothetical protein
MHRPYCGSRLQTLVKTCSADKKGVSKRALQL